MPVVDAAAIEAGARHVAIVAVFRALPFLCAGLLVRTISTKGRVACALLLVAAVVAAVVGGKGLLLFWVVTGYAYFCLCGCVVFDLPARKLNQAILLLLLLAMLVIAPGIGFPQGAKAAFFVIGWEVLLSGYSYVTDVRRLRLRPRLRDCLFFLLVNPVLVYSTHGQSQAQGVRIRGATSRVVQGATLLALATAMGNVGMTSPGNSGYALGVATQVAAWVVVEYGAHSGLASLRIGFAGQIGLRVPECYRYPLLASSPLEFWRRWNIYFAEWLTRYVLDPAARHVARAGFRHASMIALVITFVFSGLLHDTYGFFEQGLWRGRFLPFFALGGLVVVLWGAAHKALALLARPASRRGASLRILGAVVCHAGVVLLLTATAVFWR